MMLRLFLLSLAFLLATPAAADVTARYRGQSGEAMIVRLADDGDILIEHGPDVAYLTTGGATYLLLADGEGPFTTRRETFIAALQALTGGTPPPSSAERFDIEEAGEEIVAGFVGGRFSVGTAGSRQGRMEIVVSAAPELREIGRAVAAHLVPWFAVAPGTSPELVRTFVSVLDRGALLRLGLLFTLERVDRDPIPPARFRLPQPPLDQAALIARLRQSAPH